MAARQLIPTIASPRGFQGADNFARLKSTLGNSAARLRKKRYTGMTVDKEEMKAFLAPGEYIDSGHPSVVAFAREKVAGVDNPRDRCIKLYHAVRDGIKYEPYLNWTDEANFRASNVLKAQKGFCVGKAALLAACCRAVGFPSRVGYADVRNHMTSKRLRALMQSDVFCWHSYAELYIDGKWVKATPAFDATLCARLEIPPLEFDGRTDSLFQACDPDGRRRMEYLNFRGNFADVPFAQIRRDMCKFYPNFVAIAVTSGDFPAEAQTE